MSAPGASPSVEASAVQDEGNMVEEQASSSLAGAAFRISIFLYGEDKDPARLPFSPTRRRIRTAIEQVGIAHRSIDLCMNSLKYPSVAASRRRLAPRPPPRNVCCCRVNFRIGLISDHYSNCQAKNCFARFKF